MGKIRKRGDSYVIDYYAGGKRHRDVIGPNKKEAEAELAAACLEIREGTFRHRVAKKISLSDAAKKYLERHAHGRSGSDKQRYIGTFSESFKDRTLKDIQKEEVEGWLQERKDAPVVHVKGKGESAVRTEKPRSDGTCNREFAAIRHFFNTMVGWKYIFVSPCLGIKPKKEAKGRTRFLSVDEAARLIGAANKNLKPVLIQALETGMRRAEVLSMEWENVDFTARSIFVPKSKNGESRNVPMSERLVAMLKGIPRMVGCKFVYHHLRVKDGKKIAIPYKDMDTAFENACGKAGIRDFKFHDLRHTAASHMAMAGVPLKAIGAILGHKTSAMTDRYAHLSHSHLQDAVNSLPAWESTGHNLVTNEKEAAGK